MNVAVRKKHVRSNPCDGVEFPMRVDGLFRPHYMSWSEQQKIEQHAPRYLRNVVRIITETGLRIYKELLPAGKDQLDLQNLILWIPDSKTTNGRAEVPLTELAADAFRDQLEIAGPGIWLFPAFPSDQSGSGHLETLKNGWRKSLERAGVTYFRIYDLRSTYGTRLSAGGVADEWVTQMLRQGDSKVFKKYSQMTLQRKQKPWPNSIVVRLIDLSSIIPLRRPSISGILPRFCYVPSLKERSCQKTQRLSRVK